MKSIGSQKNALLIGAIALAACIVLFFGQKMDTKTGTQQLYLTFNGYQQFRKGLDISGGVRFTYKIDFSQYKELYKDQTEYLAMRRRILDIVLKNIDGRISALGVSDYNAYVQTMSDGDYLIVEIGGLQNLEEAKKLIGKTVELEFRIKNEEPTSATTLQQRKELANNLFAEIKKNPEQLAALSDGKGGEDIYYNKISQAPLSGLPPIYQSNLATIKSLQSGQLLTLEGTYATYTGYDQDGKSIEDVFDGYLLTKFLGTEQQALAAVTKETFMQSAQELGLKSTVSSTQQSGTGGITYDNSTKTASYRSQELFAGQQAYQVTIYEIQKKSQLGKTQEQVMKEAQELSVITSGALAEAKAGKKPSSPEVTTTYQGWIDMAKLQTNYGIQNINSGVQLFEVPGSLAIVVVNEQKANSDRLFEIVTVNNVSPQQFEQLKNGTQNETLYNFEEVFVRNKVSWLPAKDPKSNELLNGAYFQFAGVESNQLGKPNVGIHFNDKGKEIFCSLTEGLIGKQMAIFVGGNLKTAPTVRDKICGGVASIDGNFTPDTAKNLANELNEGALPVKLISANEEKISATLGAHAIDGALIAGTLTLLVIFVAMSLLYGRRMGLVTLFTLCSFLIVLFGIIKLTNIALSLSSIAAIILSLGMGVDANILIFERVREELKKGKSQEDALSIGYKRSRSAIKDGNISTGLIAVVLFLMGTNLFKGFGFTMIINIALILILNVPVTLYFMKLIYLPKESK